MRIKHSNMINMNMNMMKEAIDVLINSEKHILIIGETGTGKSTLLAELLINDTDVKYFDFCDIYKRHDFCDIYKRHEHLPLLKHHYLCDENFDYFDFLSAPEKTLVLNSVAIGNNLRESKVVQFIVRFIKTARKRGKRLIVVTTPSDGGVQIQNLFDTVISLTRS
ncbi:ATP-binding protein, partial [Salmonella enterica]|nr:ATP-binding protein [Salmonella enterica]